MNRIAAVLLFSGLLFPPGVALSSGGGWSLLPNSPTPSVNVQRHDDMTWIDANRGWLVNGDGNIYSTPDGGNTWIPLWDTGHYNRCVAFADSVNGYVGLLQRSGLTVLLRTANAGVSWSAVVLPSPVPAGLCGIWATNPQVVTAVGAYYGYPTMARTTNGGTSWITRDMSPWAGALVDCYFWHPDSGIAVGSTPPGSTRKPRVLMTTDGGVTWSVRWTGTRTGELCWKISFPSRQIGFVSIENLNGVGSAYYLKTKDGGLTWQETLFESGYRDCQGIGFISEDKGWLGGWDFDTEATDDGGATWGLAGFGYNINRFRFLSPELGYACGDRVYKWVAPNSGAPEPIDVSHPLFLAQNSPNPAGRLTRIHYTVGRPGAVSLELYDIMGHRLRTLFDGVKGGGGYDVLVDTENLPAGVYVYRIATPDGNESRKMWIVH